MLAVRLSEEIEERLSVLAKKTGRTKTFYVREAVEEHLEELEDYYLAADVSARVRSGEEAIYSAEEVRKELGLES